MIQFTTHYLQGITINAKLNDITHGVVQDINELCQCGPSAEHITEGAFQCFENSEQQVTFRARLHGTAQVTISSGVVAVIVIMILAVTVIVIITIVAFVTRSCLASSSAHQDVG